MSQISYRIFATMIFDGFCYSDSFRLGLISALKSLRPIAKDEEIFACYQYKITGTPLWYKKYLIDFLEEHPEGTDCTKLVLEKMTIKELKQIYEIHLKQDREDMLKQSKNVKFF
jgi:hypothetical protein